MDVLVVLIRLIILADLVEAPLQFHCRNCRGNADAGAPEVTVYYNLSVPTYCFTLSTSSSLTLVRKTSVVTSSSCGSISLEISSDMVVESTPSLMALATGSLMFSSNVGKMSSLPWESTTTLFFGLCSC